MFEHTSSRPAATASSFPESTHQPNNSAELDQPGDDRCMFENDGRKKAGPMAWCTPEGEKYVPDGRTYLTLRQAAAHTGKSMAKLRELHAAARAKWRLNGWNYYPDEPEATAPQRR
ncbi:MAG: hypothetical protein QM754_12085 [Tepidisphaeraceae bacterium]